MSVPFGVVEDVKTYDAWMSGALMDRRVTFALVLCLAATGSRAVELPIYPVDANCREATATLFQGSQLSPTRKALFEQSCVSRQQGAYNAVASVWAALQAKDQQSCLHLVQTQNYILLERCVADLRAQEGGLARLSPRSFQP